MVAWTLFLLAPLQAVAWSSAGHMVIAAEAYRQLSPGLKEKVKELLKAHPDYGKWVGTFRPDRPDLDLGPFYL